MTIFVPVEIYFIYIILCRNWSEECSPEAYKRQKL